MAGYLEPTKIGKMHPVAGTALIGVGREVAKNSERILQMLGSQIPLYGYAVTRGRLKF